MNGRTSSLHDHLKPLFLGLLLAVSCFPDFLVAANLYKWVDADGNVTYQDMPPPSGVEFEEQSYTEPQPIDQGLSERIELAAQENPIALYSVSDCDSCDLVRLYLEKRSIPFAEKNIQRDVEMQNELELKTGKLSVPTLIIGDDIVEGYSKPLLSNILLNKGFPIELIEAQFSEEDTN